MHLFIFFSLLGFIEIKLSMKKSSPLIFQVILNEKKIRICILFNITIKKIINLLAFCISKWRK